jgi:glycosyltransferase involved in cell wall biosynthesis
MPGLLPARLALAARLLAAEGPRSLVERWRDRRRDEARSRRFTLTDSATPQLPGARSPTLWFLPFPMQRRRGGAAIQLLVRLDGRAATAPVAVLQRLGDRFRCELWGRGVERPLAREWPATVAAPASSDDAAGPILLEAARWVGAARLHFESLVDLPLTLPEELCERGLPFGLSAHDFALFCPRPHLLEEPSGHFCDFSTDPVRCARCLAATWSLLPGFQEERRAVAGRLVALADQVEFPSESMRREHLRLFPALAPERTRVIPPRSLVESSGRRARPVERPPRRIAFAGAVHRHKGALEFESVVRRLEAQQPGRHRWHVFGGGDPALLGRLRRLPRTRVHGYFRAGTLPARLAAARIDLVLLPSIWPEAHCLVLDECAAAGVPVIAFALGALGERVLAEGLGEVVDLGAGAAGIADRIVSLG